jgi:hypothetical protein
MNEIIYDGTTGTLTPLPAPPPSWRSPEIGALAAALAKAQAVIEDASKTREGSIGGRGGYRYADLAEVLSEARPVLSANALAVTQLVSTRSVGDVVLAIVETVLMHESGQWIRSELSMPVESRVSGAGNRVLSGAQEVGIAITYARRYALAAIVGISQEDSDGAVAAPPPDPRPVEKRPGPKNSERPATDAQIGKVRALAGEVFPDRPKEEQAECLKRLAADMALPASSKDYTAADASRLIDRLTEIKDGHDKVPF